MEGILVGFKHSVKAINFWVEDVSIEGKAVGGLVCLRWNSGSKSIDWKLLVRVVVLKDAAH